MCARVVLASAKAAKAFKALWGPRILSASKGINRSTGTACVLEASNFTPTSASGQRTSHTIPPLCSSPKSPARSGTSAAYDTQRGKASRAARANALLGLSKAAWADKLGRKSQISGSPR